MPEIKLTWGIQPPSDAVAAWGARAIFKGGTIDLLHDRMSYNGLDNKRERKTFLQQVDAWMSEARAEAHKLYVRGHLRPDERGRFELVRSEDGFVIEADTQGSCGYLYMVAYQEGRQP